jgi:NAD(P)-dependent dehydrogenase (short-subunit alcohol dehydrogenase family)
MSRFAGRTAFVTGGTGVLCRELACALAAEGAAVCLLARNMEKARHALAAFPAGARAIAVPGDVLRQEQVEAAVARAESELGPVDLLVNGAGGNRPGAMTRPEQTFFDLAEGELRGIVELNWLGTVLVSQAVGRRMARRGCGAILNISSMSAGRPLSRVIGYAAAKAALENTTRWLAVHLAREYSPRIRVNALAPGFFLTEQNRGLLTDPATGVRTPRGEAVIAHTPMGRFGDPRDLVGPALWLLSDEAAFVTGAVIPVDGGFSADSGV